MSPEELIDAYSALDSRNKIRFRKQLQRLDKLDVIAFEDEKLKLAESLVKDGTITEEWAIKNVLNL